MVMTVEPPDVCGADWARIQAVLATPAWMAPVSWVKVSPDADALRSASVAHVELLMPPVMTRTTLSAAKVIAPSTCEGKLPVELVASSTMPDALRVTAKATARPTFSRYL